MRAALVSCVLWSTLAFGAPPPPSPPAPDLAKLFSWVMGQWVADAKPGEPTGATSFEADLDGKVLVRRNEANYPATNDKPASSHHDLMVVSTAGDTVRATYWDNEGHTIAYAVVADAEKIVFTSDPAPGPRFRFTYGKKPDGKVSVLFEMAPPNAPDAFKKYVEGVLKRP
ncbi:MAG: hypothetical protein U0228_18495 [Myxococcaceae bacterium]